MRDLCVWVDSNVCECESFIVIVLSYSCNIGNNIIDTYVWIFLGEMIFLHRNCIKTLESKYISRDVVLNRTLVTPIIAGTIFVLLMIL